MTGIKQESKRVKEKERRERERALFVSIGVLLSHTLWELLVLLSNSLAGQGDWEDGRGSIDTVKCSGHGRQFLEGGWPLCALRGQSASRLASPYRLPFLFITFPLSLSVWLIYFSVLLLLHVGFLISRIYKFGTQTHLSFILFCSQ